jgi:hypothetical protein
MEEAQRNKRRTLVRWALSMTKDTPLAASHDERHLLAQFVRGRLTIDEVVARVELIKSIG